MSDFKSVSSTTIDSHRDQLYDVSSEIWHNPELAYQEHKAHDLLTSFLEKKGFQVDRAYTGLPTAFRAKIGKGKPNMCIICEYDALPGIGHACGHNLIAEAGIAAGLGLQAVLECSDSPKMTLTVLGTPAEESGGGKVDLLKNGAFEDIDMAMMFHPAPYSVVKPKFVPLVELIITYTGKEAHAAAFPWKGVNALDAAVLAYNNISVLRQQIKPSSSIHGIITNGGVKPNIIPEKSELTYYIRGPTLAETRVLMKKCQNCFEAAAMSTGCTVEIVEDGNVYYDLMSNEILSDLYLKNASNLGIEMAEELDETGSTDMGNVSYSIPSIHPMIKIGNGEIYHTRDFTDVTNTRDAHSVALLAGKAMANTCIDVLTADGLLNDIQKAFQKQKVMAEEII